MELRWSSNWVVEPGGDASTLVLSAGADRRVAIDGLDPIERKEAEGWQTGSVVDVTSPLVDRLVDLGVLAPAIGHRPAAPSLVGDPGIVGRLRDLLSDATADRLVVAVRTGRDWPQVPPGQLHLGLDLALHHTVVLGPLVVLGASACLGCLDARMAYRWPAPVVPPEPAIQRSVAVAAELLRIQVELVAAGSSPLVNATMAWDLERGTVDRQRVYKMVGCTRCDTVPSDGRVHLPWEAE